ncbi:hypothetical protein IB277_06790 [Ensifer sp. ENS07]|uniref:hypothetical protein n=1 Tax=Ensifer sp. ENS07 TaxID=2769274 RepID=UPI00177ED7DD|nr:hypothetical protein [Ensifer sp. ENS07]MBD9635999.1 hypothetical protein [Ensifer sp. ENS07]
MSEAKPMIEAEGETLPDAYARALGGGGGGSFAVLIVLPDGSAFKVTPHDDGETADSERLNSAEALAEVMSIYGVAALKRIH